MIAAMEKATRSIYTEKALLDTIKILGSVYGRNFNLQIIHMLKEQVKQELNNEHVKKKLKNSPDFRESVNSLLSDF